MIMNDTDMSLECLDTAFIGSSSSASSSLSSSALSAVHEFVTLQVDMRESLGHPFGAGAEEPQSLQRRNCRLGLYRSGLSHAELIVTADMDMDMNISHEPAPSSSSSRSCLAARIVTSSTSVGSWISAKLFCTPSKSGVSVSIVGLMMMPMTMTTTIDEASPEPRGHLHLVRADLDDVIFTAVMSLDAKYLHQLKPQSVEVRHREIDMNIRSGDHRREVIAPVLETSAARGVIAVWDSIHGRLNIIDVQQDDDDDEGDGDNDDDEDVCCDGEDDADMSTS